MNVIEQITALGLLIDFLFGIAFGIVGGAVVGSRRGALLGPAATDPLSAGAQAIYGIYIRDDDGYLNRLLSRGNQASDDPNADDGKGWHGKEAER